jgi:hypothetical protein
MDSERIQNISENPNYEKIKMQKKWSSKILQTLKPQLLAVILICYKFLIFIRIEIKRWKLIQRFLKNSWKNEIRKIWNLKLGVLSPQISIKQLILSDQEDKLLEPWNCKKGRKQGKKSRNPRNWK